MKMLYTIGCCMASKSSTSETPQPILMFVKSFIFDVGYITLMQQTLELKYLLIFISKRLYAKQSCDINFTFKFQIYGSILLKSLALFDL